MKRTAMNRTAVDRQRIRPAAVFALTAGAAIVVLLGITMVAPHPTIAGVLGLAVLAICLTALYQATFADAFAPVAVTFWAFVTVWAGFAPLLQIRDDALPWPDMPLYQFYVTAQVILLLAVGTYWVGYRRAVRASQRNLRIRRTADTGRVKRSGRFEITVEKAIVATAIATALAAVCLPQTGGLAVRFTTRDDLQNAIKQAGLIGGKDLALLGLLSTLPAAVSLVALMLCLLCLRGRAYADAKARRFLLVTTAVAVALNVIYNNPLSANRFTSFSVLLAAALTLMRLEKLRWRVLFSATMLVGLAVVYPLANLFRNDKSRASLRLGLDAYTTYDFDSFQQTVNSVYYTHVHGHTWGYHLVSALLFWVPRSIWKGKAFAAGNVVAASRGYSFQNLGLPFWAEVFVEFSLVGVVVLFFFYGRLAAHLDRAIGAGRVGVGLALAVLFAACQIGVLRGPLGAQIPLVGAAFVVLVLTVVGWRGRAWGLTRPPEPDERGDPPTWSWSARAGQDVDGRTPRIALFADWWWPESVGGAERSARAIALELAQFAKVTVFIPAHAAKTYSDGPLTVNAVRRPFARRVHADSAARRGVEFLTAWLYPPVARRLIHAVRQFDPDVIVATNVSRTGPWLTRWAATEERGFVRVYHDLSDTCWRRSRLKSGRPCGAVCRECQIKARIMRSATPATAVSVCVSGFVRDELIDAGLTSAGASIVGYPLMGTAGGGVAVPQPRPRPSTEPAGGDVIGFIGRLDAIKGVAAAIRTAAAYGRATARPVSMVVAGEGKAEYRRQLAELAAAESVDVRFAGEMDIDAFCASVDVVLIPSAWLEPFGRVAVETGLRGLPMLVSPLGGLPEAAAVSGGRFAFADFTQPQEAAQALIKLLAGPAAEQPATAPTREAVPLAESVARAVRAVLGEPVEASR